MRATREQLIKAIEKEIAFLKRSIKLSIEGGWSTHLNGSMKRRIKELEQLINKQNKTAI